jgi:hypothetical protein
MNRYTNVIVSIENHLLWWDNLTPVDQSSQENIDRLVNVGEEIKLSEVHSWAVRSLSVTVCCMYDVSLSAMAGNYSTVS